LNIADVTALEVLYLSENRISNISALANLANLSKVWGGGCS
jgi:Leucine-rich repeat (LRR) protein